MDEKDKLDGFDQSGYEEEVRQRWGGTKEYREAAERTSRYTEEDWAAIRAEAGKIVENLASLMDRDPADPEVQNWVGRYHQLINDRFYTCSRAVFRSIGEMYMVDERFQALYDECYPGLAHFIKEAVDVYCDRPEG